VTDDERAVLRYAAVSNVGSTGHELDRNAAYAGPHLLVLADGLRTMSSPGDPAAIAVGELRRLDARTDASGLAASLEGGIEGLRETFRGLLAGDPSWRGTGTMLTAMLWRDAHAAIAHIGATRAYLLRGGELTQLTRDHTLGQLLIEEGAVRPDELGSDYRHSLIVRALDGTPGEPADITAHEAEAGDRYVLCTDGTDLDRVMSPGTLRDILRDTVRDPQDVADELAGMALPVLGHRLFGCVVADVAER
jgi:PPM family protein phosphatase